MGKRRIDNEAQIIFEELKAIRKGHYVLTNNGHSDTYVDKNIVTPHTLSAFRISQLTAAELYDNGIDSKVILSPALAGIPWSILTAYHLSEMLGHEVLSLYAERKERSLLKAGQLQTIIIGGRAITLSPGEELLIRSPEFTLGRGYDKLIKNQDFVVLDDVATTGGSIRKTTIAGILAGGKLKGIQVLCNRNKVTSSQVGNPPYFGSLFDLDLKTYPGDNCDLCRDDVPINTDVGKGKAFLERNSKK